MAEKQAYCQAAGTGKYEKPSGLLGKYDNVRRFWEDRLSAELLAPSLNDLIQDRRSRGQRLRILDIGCGSGDGYELLTGVPTLKPGLCATDTSAITPDDLGRYVGLDINEDLLDQARFHHGSNPRTDFVQGDLSDGADSESVTTAQDEPSDPAGCSTARTRSLRHGWSLSWLAALLLLRTRTRRRNPIFAPPS